MSAMLVLSSRLRLVLSCFVGLTFVFAHAEAERAAVAQGQPKAAAAAPSAPAADARLLRLEQIPAADVTPGEARHDLNEQPEVRNLYQAAATLLRNGNYQAAEDRLSAALNRSTTDYYELLYLMATAKFRLRADGEARVYASQATQVAPQAADAHYLLGEIYRRQMQPEDAIAQYRAATLAGEQKSGDSLLDSPSLALCDRAENVRIATGLLSGKTYADSAAVTYNCTSGGKLDVRTWPRGVTIDYGYSSTTGQRSKLTQ
jgi:hypothetical protein